MSCYDCFDNESIGMNIQSRDVDAFVDLDKDTLIQIGKS